MESEAGPVDVLANNAACDAPGDLFVDVGADPVRLVALNLLAPMELTRQDSPGGGG